MYLLSFYMKANRQDKIHMQKEYRKEQKREKKPPSKTRDLDCEALCSDCFQSEAGVWSSSIVKNWLFMSTLKETFANIRIVK